MKNFYRRLRLPPRATEDQIRDALSTAGPETTEAAAFVLLDARRRAVYDRNYALLVRLGELRAGLGLQHKPFWQRIGSHDFDPEPASVPGVRRGSFGGSHVNVLLKAGSRRRFRLRGSGSGAMRLAGVFVIVLLILIVAAIFYLVRP